MNGFSPNGEQPTRASIRETQGENAFTAPQPTTPTVPTKVGPKRTDNASILVAGLMLLTGILMPIFFPIGLALFLIFVASLGIFGIYALYAAIVYEPTSWGSFATTWFSASLAGLATFFAALIFNFGPNGYDEEQMEATASQVQSKIREFGELNFASYGNVRGVVADGRNAIAVRTNLYNKSENVQTGKYMCGSMFNVLLNVEGAKDLDVRIVASDDETLTTC